MSGMEWKRRLIDSSFEVSLVVKGLNAALEIASGIAIAFVSQGAILWAARILTADELSEDPSDRIANYVLGAARHFSVMSRSFLVFYLVGHGVVKLFLIACLWKKKLWAYPASIAVFGLFIAYQVYRYTYTGSAYLIALTVFDLIVLWLIWKEYRLIRSARPSDIR